MANEVKISELPDVVTPAGTDILPVVQGGVTKKESVTQVLVGGGAALGIGSSSLGAPVVFGDGNGKQLAQKDLGEGEFIVGLGGADYSSGSLVGGTGIDVQFNSSNGEYTLSSEFATTPGNIYYATETGNNVTGNGSIYLPYADPKFAISAITTNTINNQFTVYYQGNFNYTSFTIKPFVHLVALTPDSSINVDDGGSIEVVTLDPTWASVSNGLTIIKGGSLSGFDFSFYQLASPPLVSASIKLYDVTTTQVTSIFVGETGVNTYLYWDSSNEDCQALTVQGSSCDLINFFCPYLVTASYTTEYNSTTRLKLINSRLTGGVLSIESAVSNPVFVTLANTGGPTICEITDVGGTSSLQFDDVSRPFGLNILSGNPAIGKPAGTPYVNISSGNPVVALDPGLDVIPITSSTVLNGSHWGQYLIFNSASPITVTLPELATSFSTTATFFNFSNIGNGLVTFATQGSDTLTGNLSAICATGGNGTVTRTSSVNWNLSGGTQLLTGATGTLNVDTVGNNTYVIVPSFPGTATITSLVSICGSGTCTATFAIAGVNIGATANSVSSVKQTQAATSANTILAGNALTVTISANSSAVRMALSALYTYMVNLS